MWTHYEHLSGLRGRRDARAARWSKARLSDPLGIGREGRGAVDDVVDQAVVASLLRAHEPFGVCIVLELLERLAGVPLIDLVELLLHADEFLRMDEDVGRGALHA